ncbi:cation:proton antiporter [Nitratireductor pacificus]|uniref:Monovalent cation/H+ antiporter subunit F n=1 Tax=Nitratireductor pacificus pht-3B TaxID=391937 RepID=K2MGH1_9HYPH|nr:cation:proton antiporter [Nitratireductor pacificus]EKF19800.1 monovalent cation/H+ antiporter subunit F [Nitratireductor pacificus pht-3B]
MSASQEFLNFAELVALALLSLSFLLTVVRVIVGPSLPDRVLALDMLVTIAIGFIAVIGIRTGFTLYLDIAIALGLVGFLATVAFARFVLSRRYEQEFVNQDTRGIFGEKEQ